MAARKKPAGGSSAAPSSRDTRDARDDAEIIRQLVGINQALGKQGVGRSTGGQSLAPGMQVTLAERMQRSLRDSGEMARRMGDALRGTTAIREISFKHLKEGFGAAPERLRFGSLIAHDSAARMLSAAMSGGNMALAMADQARREEEGDKEQRKRKRRELAQKAGLGGDAVMKMAREGAFTRAAGAAEGVIGRGALGVGGVGATSGFAAAGAGVGAMGIAAGGVVAAAVATAAALGIATVAVGKWGEKVLESQRFLAQFSPSMAMVFAQKDIRDTFRNMHVGEATAASASKLQDALGNIKDSLAEVTIFAQNFMNRLLTGLTKLLQPIADLMAGISKTLNDWFGFAKNDKGEVISMSEWLEEVKKDFDRAKRNDDPHFRRPQGFRDLGVDFGGGDF